jgi:hypothetical protein
MIDLEKEIIEIKVAVARIEEKLDRTKEKLSRQEDFELRIRDLESYKNRLLGYAMALSTVITIGVQFLIKIFLK